MQKELNDRQRKFVEGLVAGLTRPDAYLAAFPRAVSRNAAEHNAQRLLNNPLVTEYLAEMEAEVKEQSLGGDVATRDEVLIFLSAVVRTPPGKVDELHRLCEKFRWTATTWQAWMPDKLQAVAWLSRMLGWEEPPPAGNTGGGLRKLRESVSTKEPEARNPAAGKSKARINDRQRQFVEGVLAGMAHADAYGAVYPGAKRSSQAVSAFALLEKPWVRAYLVKRREEIAHEAKEEIVATRREILKFLTAVIRTPAGAVDKLSRVCVKFQRTAKVWAVQMPSKIQAARRLCRMMGWDRPEAAPREDAMLELVERIRRKGRPGFPSES